jgi:hypothetical protein
VFNTAQVEELLNHDEAAWREKQNRPWVNGIRGAGRAAGVMITLPSNVLASLQIPGTNHAVRMGRRC